jgi:hypothetical protein
VAEAPVKAFGLEVLIALAELGEGQRDAMLFTAAAQRLRDKRQTDINSQF